MYRRTTLLGLTVLCLCAVAAASPQRVRPSLKVLDPCVQQCVQSGGDPLCCRYVCHPIGENPC
jgi:hypothetical protein